MEGAPSPPWTHIQGTHRALLSWTGPAQEETGKEPEASIQAAGEIKQVSRRRERSHARGSGLGADSG